ncbi:nitrate regulatory gene2 protein-like [Ipomoea triloba]|uniref:nitrate regulatory gene2 protein-like n=1 Tax=Ipomoea triloba TaxID=35885 RepID=UPI00125E03B1|nr:nitrate regulatory gene2 protein-like [Ipomoea triloba]XP_031108219.1 nitrate regulatory gene2 protein-like [Ipomoea triloba]
MGCSTSKLDSQEAVQLCKDRKMFIEQAVEYRLQFALGHVAYIESMRRVSSALRGYIEGEEYSEFLVDAFTTPAFTPVKKINSGFISIASKSFTMKPLQSEKNSSVKENYFKSGGSSSISVEEKPQSHEILRVEAYSPVHQSGMDGFFAMHSVPISSSFYQSSPNNMPNFPSPSPQNSQWDSFWDPFSSLDYYGYPVTTSLDQTILDDGNGITQVQKEEAAPDLEKHIDSRESSKEKSAQIRHSLNKDEVVVEDVNDGEKIDDKIDSHHLEKELQPNANHNTAVEKTQNDSQLSSKETTVVDCEAKKEIPGFTVYVNTRPTRMAEAIKDLEAQFRIACNSAKEVSAMLEATEAQNPSILNDLTPMKMLNPVALFRSGSSKSLSSKFLVNPSIIEENIYQNSSHQSTLDRLHLWEKKLYQEVRAGERVRLAYEKKCAQLRNQEENNADHPSIDKTRAAIGSLLAQIKVSIHSVEAISKRIETLRDEELQPQLLQLMQGLGKMWKVMAECHQLQKCILDEAKVLLSSSSPSKHSAAKSYTKVPPSDPQQLGRSAANLEIELRNWRACFESWIVSQRSYLHALTGWLLCCVHANPSTSKLLPFSSCISVGAPPVFSICIQWSRLLDSINEVPVLDGLDFFMAGIGSLSAQQLREDPHRSKETSNTEVVEAGKLVKEEALTAEKIGVVYSGMSASVSALTEFAIVSAEGYADLLKNWEDKK